MSNHLAVAAVTATLRDLLLHHLQAEAPDVSVTTRPPDKARGNVSGNQLNLFLYQLAHDAQLRNLEGPPHGSRGGTGQPPLALHLLYVLTAFTPGEDEIDGHRLLGKAMSVLHDHSVLETRQLQVALSGHPTSYLPVERVRLTPEPLSLEELSRLWSTFQSQYRLSVAYRVSPVLIESTRPRTAPLPVLHVPAPGVRPEPVPVLAFPVLEAIHPPKQQATVGLGEKLSLTGQGLKGRDVRVWLMTARWREPVSLPAQDVSPSHLTVRLPVEAPEGWPAGVYSAAVVVGRAGGAPRTSNALSLSLAPRLSRITPDPVPRGPDGSVTLTVDFTPPAWAEQHVSLLLGDREVPAPARPGKVGSLSFTVPDVAPGAHCVRLRVDGVDSLLVDRGASPPVFHRSQWVHVT